MDENKPLQQSEFTRRQFLENIRSKLPEQYQYIDDERLFELAAQKNPNLSKIEFKPEPTNLSPLRGAKAVVKQFAYSVPGSLTGLVSALSYQIAPEDPAVIASRNRLFQASRRITNKWMQDSEDIQAYQQWAGENIFSWGEFFTNPTMFATTFASVAGSMALSVGASLAGAAITRSQWGAYIGGMLANFISEGGSPVNEAYDRGVAKGFTPEQLDKVINESYLDYASVSSFLEPVVPMIILNRFGFSAKLMKKTFSRFAANYIDESVATGGKVGADLAIKSMQKIAGQNLSVWRKLMTVGAAMGLTSLAEGTTEAAQNMFELAILDNKVDGTQIDAAWITEHLQYPEVQQSFAGGLVSPFMFGFGGTSVKFTGNDGKSAAKYVQNLKDTPEEVLRGMEDPPIRPNETKEDFITRSINAVIEGDNISLAGKIEFSKAILQQEYQPPPVETLKKASSKPQEGLSNKKTTITTPPTQPPPTTQKTTEKEPIIRRFIQPELGEAPSKALTLPTKAIDWALRNPEQFKAESRTLAEPEKQVFADVVSAGLLEVAKNTIIKDKEGNVVDLFGIVKESLGKKPTFKSVYQTIDLLTRNPSSEGKLIALGVKQESISKTVSGETFKESLLTETFEQYQSRVGGAAIEETAFEEPGPEVEPEPEGQFTTTKAPVKTQTKTETSQNTPKTRFLALDSTIRKDINALIGTKGGKQAQELMVEYNKIYKNAAPKYDSAPLAKFYNTLLAPLTKAAKGEITQVSTKPTTQQPETPIPPKVGPAKSNINDKDIKEDTSRELYSDTPSSGLLFGASVTGESMKKKVSLKIMYTPGVKHKMPTEFRNKSVKSRVVLESIANNSESKHYRGLAKLLLKVPSYLDYVTAEWDETINTSKFNPMTTKIRMYPYHARKFEKVFLHEAVHAVLYEKIKDVTENHFYGSNTIEYKTVQRLDALWKHIQKELGPEKLEALKSASISMGDYLKGLKDITQLEKGLRGWEQLAGMTYFSTNLHEFASEAVTNPILMKYMNELLLPEAMRTPRIQTVWQKFREYVARLLGLRFTPGSALEAAFHDILQLASVKDISVVHPAEFGHDHGQINELESESTPTYDEETGIGRDEQEGQNYKEESLPYTFTDPRIFLSKTLFRAYHVYLDPKKDVPRLIDIAKSYKGRTFLTDINFDAFVAEVNKFISEIIKTDYRPRDTAQWRMELKQWFQYINNRIPIAFNKEVDADTRMSLEVIVDTHGNLRNADFVTDVDGKSINKATHRQNLRYVQPNFAEKDLKEGNANKLVYLSIKEHLYVEHMGRDGNPYYTSSNNTTISPMLLRSLNNFFYNQFKRGQTNKLYLFLAETKGDNTQLVLTIGNPKFNDFTMADYTAYMGSEADAGNMTQAEVKDSVKSNAKMEKEFPGVWAIMAAAHDRMKSIKGNRYLMKEIEKEGTIPEHKRYRNLANLWKRLKIDLGHGETPWGSGPSSIMWLNNTDDLTFEVFEDGKYITVQHKLENGKYAFDGWLMTSKNYFDKIGKIMGEYGAVMKTYIRHLDWSGRKDYLAVKMMEKVPFENTRIWRTDASGTKQMVAEYKNGTWKDANKVEFDRLGTNDEVKDADGIYAEPYKIHPLNEADTMVLNVRNRSPRRASHPVKGHELALLDTYVNAPAGKKYITAVFNHYKAQTTKYLDYLYKFIRDPNTEREFLYTELQQGELADELHAAFQLWPNGEGLTLWNYIHLIKPQIARKLIRQGMYRMKQFDKDMGTFLNIEPWMGSAIPQDTIYVSSDSETMFRIVAREFAKVNPGSNLGSLNRDDAVNILNKFLSQHEVWTLVHRQPILSHTSMVPRKIGRLVTGGHGESVFMNPKDTFEVHEGDHDGDEVFIETFENNELMDSIRELSKTDEWKKRGRVLDLKEFIPGSLGGSPLNYSDVLDYMRHSSLVRGAEGMVVNNKTLLAELSYKDVRFSIDKGAEVFMYRPDDKVIIDYLPLDPEYLESKVIYNGKSMTVRERIIAEGDRVVLANGSDYVPGQTTTQPTIYLETTKENEFSILLQSAVDHQKFGLLSRIPLGTKKLHAWLATRMFRKTDGSQLTDDELKMTGDIRNLLGYSKDRRTEDANDRLMNIDKILAKSIEISNRYMANKELINRLVAGELATPEELVKINKTLTEQLRSIDRAIRLSTFTTNGKITPLEYMLIQLGLRHDTESARLTATLGRGLNDPISFEHDVYSAAHQRTMIALEDKFANYLSNISKKDAEEGINFYQTMSEDFFKVRRKVDNTFMNKNLSEDEQAQAMIDYARSPEMTEFYNKYFDAWKALSSDAKKAGTIYYLKGVVVDKKAVQGVLKMLPTVMMHPTVFREYGIEHAKQMKLPFSSLKLGNPVTVYPELSAVIKQIKEVCG